jgi:hypothetical protein
VLKPEDNEYDNGQQRLGDSFFILPRIGMALREFSGAGYSKPEMHRRDDDG